MTRWLHIACITGLLAAGLVYGVATAAAISPASSMLTTEDFVLTGQIVSVDLSTGYVVVDVKGQPSVAKRHRITAVSVDVSAAVICPMKAKRGHLLIDDLQPNQRVKISGTVDLTDSSLPLYTAAEVLVKVQ